MTRPVRPRRSAPWCRTVEFPIVTRRAPRPAPASEADRAERARAARDEDAARAAIVRARAFADVVPAVAVAARVAVAAEVARAEGRSDPAAWAAAIAAWDERGAAFQAAYARWRRAEALLAEGGDRRDAAGELRAAREAAERLGARPLRDEIDALARRARLDLAPAAAPAAAARPELPAAARELGLTPRELEVLEHVAMGQTNREIAAELFISARTAGVHVSHILEKLGASTRTEAAAAAHRLGLAP